MCPSGLTLYHPAAGHLLEHATNGCPTSAGKSWTRDKMQAAMQRGPHVSVMVPDAMKQLASEIEDKVRSGPANIVLFDDIKDNPPEELKVSPIVQ